MVTYVLSAVRTPIGKLGGSLRTVPTTELGGIAIRAAVERAAIDPATVDSVHLGLCLPTGGMTAARSAALAAGLALSTRSLTIDRACCSAMTAIGQSMAGLAVGDVTITVAGGMENMSRTPLLFPAARGGTRVGDVTMEDPLVIRNPYLDAPMARYTGEVAIEYGVDRPVQDAWSVRSQQHWAEADAGGRFADELVGVQITEDRGRSSTLTRDEHPRPGTSLDDLARLKTVYGSPTVTAGNAPGLNDGASALVLVDDNGLEQTGARPIARVLTHVAIAGEPRQSVRLPADAIRLALDRVGMRLQDIDLIEINEAFAATAVVSTRSLAESSGLAVDEVQARTNVHGGAVAMGHPIGASGARIVTTLIHALRGRGGGLGVAAICGGIGQADAVVVRVD
jgi:acetyl-CoA C-acetyltransferase